MKKDLLTSIALFIIGIVAAYLIVGLFFGEDDGKSVTVKTVGTSITSSISEPDPEVFNYRAINPTVEVYVGECTVYDILGNCLIQENQPESAPETESGSESEAETELEPAAEDTHDHSHETEGAESEEENGTTN